MATLFSQPTRRRLRTLAVCCAIALMGCGSGEDPSELTELEALPLLNPLAEVSFGEFNIPIPGVTTDARQRRVVRNHLQLQFKLHGLVAPEEANEFERLAERRRGDLRDCVIRICRSTSVDELEDPDLLTLKLRLIDATETMFEGLSIDQLLLNDVMIDAL